MAARSASMNISTRILMMGRMRALSLSARRLRVVRAGAERLSLKAAEEVMGRSEREAVVRVMSERDPVGAHAVEKAGRPRAKLADAADEEIAREAERVAREALEL